MLSRRLHLAAGALLTALAIGHPAVAAPSSSHSRSPDNALDSLAVFVAEASQRFGLPEAWIRAVMHVESGGAPSATSTAGAIGLMQVMPQTYGALRARLGLGANAYDPHDNIIAGAAYLREMHDRYGSAGFLAAYNAGPGRWEDHLAGVRQLPAETVRYIARLGPMLGVDGATVPLSDMARAKVTPEAALIFVALRAGAATLGPRPLAHVGLQVATADVGSQRWTNGLSATPSALPPSSWNGVRSDDPVAPVAAPRSLFVPRTPVPKQPR